MNVKGVALEYACFGPPPSEAPTIVLLHEGLGCVALWRDIPELLSERTGLGVLAYSRQGYGQSDPADLPLPLDFMTREAVDVLPRVLEQSGIRRCILFGHSDGATIAAIYAGSVEDHRVRGLILEAPHFFTEEMGLREIARARDSFAASDMRDRMAKYHRDPEGAFRGWCDTWLDAGFKGWNVSEVIDYIRVPILAIQGRGDQYGTLAQIDEIETRAYCPVDTAVLDCQHAPHHEAREATLEAVSEYCARLLRIEAAEVAPA
ncbi:alpha/beta hydrolase [Ruegeria sediminis]|uniref:Alpha/beta hydrolase n=2 Tax=Ruegeria sediminis TaxID=2583820 RepID=A0ABY2WXY7_9RHOB|nr:alpha/beta hydrolase [Ruegeria sediminis]